MSKNYSRADWGLFALRFSLAVVFIAHGVQKLMGMTMVTGFFGTLGLPPVIAWAVAIAEVVAGIAMLIGVYTQYAGYALMVIMIGAIFLLKMGKGFVGGYEYELTLLFVSLAVTLLGAGGIVVPVKIKS